LLLDMDDSGLTPEEAVEVFSKIDPQFETAGLAVIPSSSSYLYNEGQEIIGAGNYHIFAEIRGNSVAYGNILFNRLVLNGYGKPFVTKAGSVIIKSIFDKVVLGWEREIYEATPLLSKGLSSTRLDHISMQEGSYIDPRKLPELTPEEEVNLREVIKKLRASVTDMSVKRRGEHNERRAKQRSKINGSNYLHELGNINDAEILYDRQGRPIIELKSDEWIYLEDGTQCQVHDFLLNPQDGLKLPDPIEPWTRGDERRGIPGKGVATLLGSMIYSHAHCGIIYPLRWDYADLGEILRTSDNDTRTFVWKAIATGRQEISASTDDAQISELADEIKTNLQNVKGSGVGKDKKFITSKLKVPAPPKDAEDDILLEYNSKYGMTDIGGKATIIQERWSTAGEIFEVIFKQPMSMDVLSKNEPVKMPGVPGGKISAYKYWEQHPERNQFMDGADFIPNAHTFRKPGVPRVIQQKGSVYNMFQGYILDVDRATSCELIIKHIKEIWCSNNPVEYEYALAWMARMVQKPAEVSTTALVLRSVPGAGKGIICDKVFVKTFGIHAISTANQEDVTGRFNAHLGMNLFLFANEMAYTAQASVKSTLKTMLSDEYRLIEAKNVNKIHARNYTSAIFASNDSWMLNIDAGDRRFVYLTVSSAMAGNREYFKALVDEIENGGREAFILWLLKYDYSKIDLKKIPDNNQCQRRVDFLRSAHACVRFIYSLADVDTGVAIYATHAMHKRLKDWQSGVTQELVLDKSQFFDVFVRYCEYFQVNRQYDDVSTFITQLEQGAILATPNSNKAKFAMTTRLKDGKNVLVLKSIKECQELLKV